MPHSSGGGSHSGGSHSSSAHSSGGGSHYGSSSSQRSDPVYNTYRPGTHRYVYYKHKQPQYYYSASRPSAMSKKGLFVVLLVTLGFMLFFLPFWAFSVNRPKPLSADYDTTIVIDDTLGVFSDNEKTELLQTLTEFQDITGITVAIKTIPNSEWSQHYETIGDYAYDYYVNSFSDEKHWLLVYSTEKTDDFDDWYWEGMQGDLTDPVLTSEQARAFNKTVQKALTNTKDYTVATAFIAGFDAIMPSIMNASINKVVAITLGIVELLCIIPCFIVMIYGATTVKYDGSIRCKTDDTVIEDTCEYCGGVYVHGLHNSCPHCGAPIKALNKQ